MQALGCCIRTGGWQGRLLTCHHHSIVGWQDSWAHGHGLSEQHKPWDKQGQAAAKVAVCRYCDFQLASSNLALNNLKQNLQAGVDVHQVLFSSCCFDERASRMVGVMAASACG
jgi:hypothetical protein